MRSTLPPDAGWWIATSAIALVVIAPVASLAWLAVGGSFAHWIDLARDVLPAAAWNTALLLAGVGVMVALIGAGAAWMVTAFDFPGRRFFDWALLLPLAMPTYIVAFAYLDLLHPLGPVQSALRWMLGLSSPRELRLGDLRGMGGAIFLLSSVLYPYVYMTARAMFMTQPAHLLEAARMLGAGPLGAFWRVALPMARPALAVGVTLALLETLNDIGASEFLGVQTLTVSIYTAWVTRSDLAGAAQLAMLMLVCVLLLMYVERRSRARQRFASVQKMRPLQPVRLRGAAAWTATALAALPIVIGFALPALYLVGESFKRVGQSGLSPSLGAALANTLLVALGVACICVAGGLVVAWTTRAGISATGRSAARTALARAASLGYALPGTVLAVGLLAPALAVDYLLGDLLGTRKLILLGAGAILVAGCVIRFLAISVGALESAMARVPPALEQSARLLGETANRTLGRVYLPLLRPALAASAMLVFADAMKELPATLLLRPANFETLATLVYAEAARGTYEDGAVAALAIVVAGLLPVALLAKTQLRFKS